MPALGAKWLRLSPMSLGLDFWLCGSLQMTQALERAPSHQPRLWPFVWLNASEARVALRSVWPVWVFTPSSATCSVFRWFCLQELLLLSPEIALPTRAL